MFHNWTSNPMQHESPRMRHLSESGKRLVSLTVSCGIALGQREQVSLCNTWHTDQESLCDHLTHTTLSHFQHSRTWTAMLSRSWLSFKATNMSKLYKHLIYYNIKSTMYKTFSCDKPLWTETFGVLILNAMHSHEKWRVFQCTKAKKTAVVWGRSILPKEPIVASGFELFQGS